MDYNGRRTRTLSTLALMFLLNGVEYAVILPTIWRFLQTLDAPPYFLGLSLSAFSLSGLVTAPLFGFWSDRTHRTKNILLFSNCFEIIGNFLYFWGFSRWLLLISRFIAGIGTGAGSCIFGFLTRITDPEDRATVFAAVMACRQAGLLIAFLREEVLLTAQFITLFNQTALETMVTPLTQQFFHFGELENSVMYCVCGVEVIAGFLFVRWLSRRVEERVVLSVGLVLANISCVWCLVFLADSQGGFLWQLVEFIICVFLQVLGLPFIGVAQVSLFSKVTDEKTQGFARGIRRSVGGLATILGPLWAGCFTSNIYVMLGVMMVLLVLLAIMMTFSYERLVAHPEIITLRNETRPEQDDSDWTAEILRGMN
ncbi:uncharacterized protein mfsd8l1 [Trichomycterus rosablanca]|uniref:uncharacterized protein mfsd8l1 n=1 Tax=Trichomycterus rosablanca TaxID=2290929 RepID=UPI002F35DCA6